MSDETVSSQAQRGVLALLGRHAVLFPVNMLAGILLARLLSPADFGAYATVAFLVMGAGVLLDVGLGAILVQQAEEPTERQLRSIFTAQVLVFGGAMAAVMLLAPWLAAAFHLPAAGEWLLRGMSLHMLIGAFGGISTLLLERRMGFSAFARLDVVNVLLDRGLTLGLAFAGWGVWSFLVGSLVSTVVRVGLLYRAAPWAVGFALDRDMLKRALAFGAFFQGGNLTMLARDNMNALLGGMVFGPKAVGLLNWGMNVANTCSHAFVQVVGRVSFPAFARLHDQPAERERLVATSLVALNLATFPVLAIVAVLADPIVTHVYGEAWRPAIPALICFAIRMMGTNTTSILINFLNATGQVKRGFRIAAVWTAVEWALALALVPFFGFYGIAYAYAAGVWLPVIWLLAGLRRELPLPLGRAYGAPVAVAAGGAALAWALSPWATSLVALAAVLGISGLVSFSAAALLERERLEVLLARFTARRAPEGTA